MGGRWSSSTIFTKIATLAMILALILMLIINILLIANGGINGFYVFSFIVTFLLVFGLFKVNGAARVIISILGIIALFYVVALIWVFSAADSASGGLYSLLFGIINAIIPDRIKALMGVFVLPYILSIISWICLIPGGKDFKKEK